MNNIYYMLRHGEAVSNAKNIVSSWPETFENPLTEKGVAVIKESATVLQDKKIDIIVASDVLRTKQTAEIVAGALGLPVQFDARLREISFGDMNGKTIAELEQVFGRYRAPGYKRCNGEDYADVTERVYNLFEELESRHEGKTILLVSHQSPLCLLEEKVKGMPLLTITATIPGYWQIDRGEVRKLVLQEEFINYTLQNGL